MLSIVYTQIHVENPPLYSKVLWPDYLLRHMYKIMHLRNYWCIRIEPFEHCVIIDHGLSSKQHQPLLLRAQCKFAQYSKALENIANFAVAHLLVHQSWLAGIWKNTTFGMLKQKLEKLYITLRSAICVLYSVKKRKVECKQVSSPAVEKLCAHCLFYCCCLTTGKKLDGIIILFIQLWNTPVVTRLLQGWQHLATTILIVISWQ